MIEGQPNSVKRTIKRMGIPATSTFLAINAAFGSIACGGGQDGVDVKITTPSPTVRILYDTPTPIPDQVIVDRAIQSGEINISSAEDVGRFFVGIDQQTADKLLGGSKAKGDVKFLFPFDPTGVKFSMAGRKDVNKETKKFAGGAFAVNDLSSEVTIKAPMAGKGIILDATKDIDGKKTVVSRNLTVSTNGIGDVSEGYQFIMHVPIDSKKLPPFSEQQVPFDVPVSEGSEMLAIKPEMKVVVKSGTGDISDNFIVDMQTLPRKSAALNDSSDSLDFFLTVNGKIAYVFTPGVGK